MNEGGQNELSPFNEPTSPTTPAPKMDTHVPADGVEAFPGMHTERGEMEAAVCGDGVEGFPAMHRKGLQGKQKSLLMEWNPSQPWKS